MPTLMSADTFTKIRECRSTLAHRIRSKTQSEGANVAGALVPWVGSNMIQRGGIYYVGMGSDGEWGADGRESSSKRG